MTHSGCTVQKNVHGFLMAKAFHKIIVKYRLSVRHRPKGNRWDSQDMSSSLYFPFLTGFACPPSDCHTYTVGNQGVTIVPSFMSPNAVSANEYSCTVHMEPK